MVAKLTSETRELSLTARHLTGCIPVLCFMLSCHCLFFQAVYYECNKQIEWKMRKTPRSDDKWIRKLLLCPFTGLKRIFLALCF